MILTGSRSGVPRGSSRAAFAAVVALAFGCSVAGGFRPKDAARSSEGVDAAVVRPKRVTCDGPEQALGIEWEKSLEAAMERGRREKKPVLVAFSARRQDHDFGGEF
jgi:hypothetical protein